MYFSENSDSWNIALLVFVVLVLLIFWIHNYLKIPVSGVKSIIG